MTSAYEVIMKTYTAIVEHDKETGLFVGYIPGFPGAHSQGDSLDELNRNLKEAIELHLQSMQADGEPIPPTATTTELIEV